MSQRSQKRKLLPRLVLGGILLVVPAAADAPADQYDAFTKDSTVIVDHFTTLQWLRTVERKLFTTEAAAESYCTSFGATVPTVKELLTLVDEEPHQEYEGRSIVSKMIDANAFPGTPVDQPYWTTTEDLANGGHWTVSFATGKTKTQSDGGTGAYVRCVK